MKLRISLLIIFIITFSNYSSSNELLIGIHQGGTGNDVYTFDKATGTSTKVATIDCTGNGNTLSPNTSFVDSYEGIFYVECNNGRYVKYDIENGSQELAPTGLDRSGFHKLYQAPWGRKDNTTIISFGTDPSDNTSLTTMFGSSNLVDSDNKTIIKTTSDGATHIGENSLVTIEENGRQSLYATNASGGKIDIDVNNGSDLLVKGVSVMGSIKGNAAMAAAMSALPNTSDENGYNCGVGTGFHGSASAFAIGCSSKFLPSRFNNAVFNVASSHLINSGYSNSSDDFSLRAGVSFKLGQSIIQTSSLSSNYEIEDELEKLKKENAMIISQNKKLLNQINEINNKIELLNVIALK